MRPGSPCVCNRFGGARRRRRPRQHPGPRPTGVHGRRRGPEAAVGPIRRSLSPNRRPSRLPHGRLDGRAAPSRPRRKAPYLLLERRDGRCVTRRRQRSGGRVERVDTPARSYSAPTYPRRVPRPRPSGERHGGSISEAACAAGTPRRPADRRLTTRPHPFQESRKTGPRPAPRSSLATTTSVQPALSVRFVLADLFHNRAATPPCTRHFATRSASGRPQPGRSTCTAPTVVSRWRSRPRRSERARPSARLPTRRRASRRSRRSAGR